MIVSEYLSKYFNIIIDEFVLNFISSKEDIEDVINVSYILKTNCINEANYYTGLDILNNYFNGNNFFDIDLSLSPTATIWFYNNKEECNYKTVEVEIKNNVIYCEIL